MSIFLFFLSYLYPITLFDQKKTQKILKDKLHRDSIEKLNSLIDELDLLQRGVEMPKMAIDHEVERQEEVVSQQEYIQNNCEVVTLRYKEPKVESPSIDGVETRNRVTSFKQPPQSPTTPTSSSDQCDGVFRNTNRPIISPRPASLSGLFHL